MKHLYIETYGCQMNVADSEVVAAVMRMAGYEMCDSVDTADAVFLNTCSVRDNAEQKIIHRLEALHAMRKKGRKLIIGVLGCMAERVKEGLLNDHHADLVAGPDAYLSLPDLIAQAELGEKAINIELSTTETYRDIVPDRVCGNRLSGFVSIMRGCNNFCHYCVVPYTRGRERSRDIQSIINEVDDLVAKGFKEIILLGQNVNSYGKGEEHGVNFAELLRRINAIPGDFTIRFMTSHPKDATTELLDTIAACEKVSRHFHLPFQSGNDRVLKAMNRRYTREQYLDLVRYARSVVPDISFTSDVIVGFPGETREEFNDTLSLVEEVGFTSLFTFIFSPRAGTPAAAMEDPVSMETKTAWFQELTALQEKVSAQRLAALVGTEQRALLETAEEGYVEARLASNSVVRVDADPALVGRYALIRIDDARSWIMNGTVLSIEKENE